MKGLERIEIHSIGYLSGYTSAAKVETCGVSHTYIGDHSLSTNATAKFSSYLTVATVVLTKLFARRGVLSLRWTCDNNHRFRTASDISENNSTNHSESETRFDVGDLTSILISIDPQVTTHATITFSARVSALSTSQAHLKRWCRQ